MNDNSVALENAEKGKERNISSRRVRTASRRARDEFRTFPNFKSILCPQFLRVPLPEQGPQRAVPKAAEAALAAAIAKLV